MQQPASALSHPEETGPASLTAPSVGESNARRAVQAGPSKSISASTVSVTHKVLLAVLLAVSLWLPRGLGLDRFVAIDERTWFNHASNFYVALRNGDLANTYQIYHPGVTTLWAAAGGFLWQYPSYAADLLADEEGRTARMSRGISEFLRAQGRSPMETLAAARAAMVLVQVTLLVLAFWLAVDLVGLSAAVAGVLLIAVEPFILGLSRMLHVDGMGAVLMFVCVLALLHYQRQGRRRGMLILSGVLAGMAWLTRSPAFFLGPFAAIFLSIEWFRQRNKATDRASSLMDACVIPLLIWGSAAAIAFVALWPAMWVDPVGSLVAVLGAAIKWSGTGHTKQLFFEGQLYTGDPGIRFYPATYLWRTTPVTLLGLGLALLALLRLLLARLFGPSTPGTAHPTTPVESSVHVTRRTLRFTAGWLAIYSLLFLLFMTLGDKKFPRYLLPIYYPLTLLAGLGWAVAAQWLVERVAQRAAWADRLLTLRSSLLFLVALPFVAQAALVLPHFPYYFTFYNPLLGGIERAQGSMPIGLGEGIDQAARYLLQKPDAASLTVATWYRGGSFNYIFPYESVEMEEFYRADYAVLYVHQWQRRVPDDRLLDYFAKLAPEHIVHLHGIEYAYIYDLRGASPAPYFTDWGAGSGADQSPAIRHVYTELPPEGPGGFPVIQADEPFVVRLHLYALQPTASNLNVIVRLLNENGAEVARSEGWPFGSPTSSWEPGQLYLDGHEFTLTAAQIAANQAGYFRVEASFYDPATLETLTPVMAGTQTPHPDFLPVGYLWSGPALHTPQQSYAPPVQLGDSFSLVGMDLATGTADDSDVSDSSPALWERLTGQRANVMPEIVLQPGADFSLRLYWSTNRPTTVDYTVLLHLTGPAGAASAGPRAQWDRQPVAGLIPTSLWQDDDIIVDRYQLALPADLPPGEYQLTTGFYDLATLERLPIIQDARPAGDTWHLATVTVEAP